MNITQIITDRIVELTNTPMLESEVYTIRRAKKSMEPYLTTGFGVKFIWKITRFRRLRIGASIYDSGAVSISVYTRNHFFSSWKYINSKFYDERVIETKIYEMAEKERAAAHEAASNVVLQTLT